MHRIDKAFTACGQALLHVFVGMVKCVFYLPLLTVALYEGRVPGPEKERAGLVAGALWFLCVIPLALLQNPATPVANVLIFTAALHYALGAVYFATARERAERQPSAPQSNDEIDYGAAR